LMAEMLAEKSVETKVEDLEIAMVDLMEMQ
jgi:hypothetical protein